MASFPGRLRHLIPVHSAACTRSIIFGSVHSDSRKPLSPPSRWLALIRSSKVRSQANTASAMYTCTCTYVHTTEPSGSMCRLWRARKVKQLESLTGGLINTFSYRLCSWCLGRRPSGTKEHPRTLRNCRRPLRPVPGSSGQHGSSCFRFSATDRIVVVSRVLWRSFLSFNPREQSPFAFLFGSLFRRFFFLLELVDVRRRRKRRFGNREKGGHSLEDALGVSRDLWGFLVDGVIFFFFVD